MRAAWFVARTQLRQRWGSVVVLTLIVGFTGAVVLASLAGARRTSSAVSRFRDETLAPDLTVFLPAVDDATIDGLRALPGVEALGVGRQLTASTDGAFDLAVGGPFDNAFGRTVDRPRVLDGRLPQQDRVREVAVPEPLARGLGFSVGDTFVLRTYSPAQVEAILDGSATEFDDPEGPHVDLRVVGVTRVPGDLSFEGDSGGLVLTTRAFVDRYGDQIGSFSGLVLRVRTTDGDAARNFVRIARERTARFQSGEGEFQVQPSAETEGAVQESIDVVATGLVVFAVVAAIAGVVVVAVVMRRYVDGGASDLSALRGLGLSRGGRTLALAFAALPIALAGSALAVVGAWLASPLFPRGLARSAEPDLGLDVDPLVLAGGLVAGVLLVGLLALWSGHRVVNASLPSTQGAPRPSAVRGSWATGMPPSMTVGFAMATGRERAGGPAPGRAAVAGALVAVMGVVAVVVVTASLQHLERTPRAYGYNWDAHVEVEDAERADPTSECSRSRTAVADDAAVAAATDVCADTIEVEGYSTEAYGFTSLKGDIGPTVLEGRAPRAGSEVALGTRTLDRVRADVGDPVRIDGPGAGRRYRVVGRVLVPALVSPGEGNNLQAVADGALFTGAGLERIASTGTSGQARILVRWRDGVDVGAASQRIGRLSGGTNRPLHAAVPLEVDRLQQLHALPWLLGAFLSVIGVLGLGYGLVTSVRRRARELAILKTVGFRRGQIGGAVATQATAYAVVGLVIGIPLGVLVGRAAWSRIAGRSGFEVVSVVPLAIVALVVVATLVIVNVVAWFPARRAARVRPAVVLRSE
jgi:ABC-type lipoprotein release transport system permease subunit